MAAISPPGARAAIRAGTSARPSLNAANASRSRARNSGIGSSPRTSTSVRYTNSFMSRVLPRRLRWRA